MSGDLTLADVLSRQAETAGDRVAIAKVTGSGETSDLTYGDLHRGAHRLAAWFEHEAGLRTGDRVAVLLDNESVHEFFLSLAACWVGGFVAAPLNARLAAPELAYRLDHSGAKSLVTSAAFAPTIVLASNEESLAIQRVLTVGGGDVNLPWPLMPFEQARASEHQLTLPAPGPGTLCDLIYTSGTTGRPKGALFDHQACVAQAA